MMRFFQLVLFIVACLVGASALAQEAIRVSAAEARKNFPGGIDESDLSVQSVKRITRKGEELEPEHLESGDVGHGGEGGTLEIGD